MNVSNLRQQSPERLDLLAPLLAPAEADRCEAIGAECSGQVKLATDL